MKLTTILVATLIMLTGCATKSTPPAPATAAASIADNSELAALYAADQDDRKGNGDWHEIGLRDEQRELRVREILAAGGIQSSRDYYHAAMVFQHSSEGDGLHLAHELSLIGATLGDKSCRWLAAASYDRLLMNLGHEQRFGTQFFSRSGPPKLSPLLPGVTDAMRAALNVPSLERAKAREEKYRLDWEQSQQNAPPSK